VTVVVLGLDVLSAMGGKDLNGARCTTTYVSAGDNGHVHMTFDGTLNGERASELGLQLNINNIVN